ncbi:MAG: C39 family peptidase, partial [Planctomycetota bacterium]
CYQEGQGVDRDHGQALFWYKKALERGHKGACWPLGVLYYEGKGVRQDVSRARELWSIAKTRRSYAFHVTPEEIDALERRGSKAEKHVFLGMRHILQGHNMCAPTSAAMTLNYYGFKCDPYQIKLKCPKSPVGTGTGWDKLVIGIEAVSGKKWQTAEVPYDDAGFDDGLARTKANLDKGFPVLVDIREVGSGQRPQGSAHTVVAIGYDESKRVIYFQDPAIKYPGVRAFPYGHFKRAWNSQWYRSDASGKIVRPFILTSWKD